MKNVTYLFELKHGSQSFYHWVLFVVLHQVSEGVELFTSSHIVLEVVLWGERGDESHITLFTSCNNTPADL